MGATSLVPRMLITEAFDKTRFNGISVQLIERSELNAVACHHIVGQSGADSVEIWIDEELTLRRVLTASDMSAEMQQNLIAEAQKVVQSFSPSWTGTPYRLITDVRYNTVAISPALIGKN
jgi:hypothetical protein